MTICPECREIAARVVEKASPGFPGISHTCAAAVRALPTHAPDAETRETLCEMIATNRRDHFGTDGALADAILAHLHQQGWRRVGEGEVVVQRHATEKMQIAGSGTLAERGARLSLGAAKHCWDVMLRASEGK